MPVLGFIGGLGAPELLIVLCLVLILFGAGRLPQVFEQFGKAVKNFREAQRDDPIDAEKRRSQIGADLAEDADEVRAAEREHERV